MSDFLADMRQASERRADALRDSAVELKLAATDAHPPLPLVLDGFGVIAEIKRRSPAEGVLAENTSSIEERAATYEAAGAMAISVLTEPERFDGDLAHLQAAVASVNQTPVMRKDFLVDPLQLYEARAAGASGVLLIAAMLDDQELRRMSLLACDLGMFVLLEAFDREDVERMTALLELDELQRAAASGQLLFGVNSRNLRTLAVDPERLGELASTLPDSVIRVAESGVLEASDAKRVSSQGYQCVLVGTALMRTRNVGELIGAMRQAGISES